MYGMGRYACMYEVYDGGHPTMYICMHVRMVFVYIHTYKNMSTLCRSEGVCINMYVWMYYVRVCRDLYKCTCSSMCVCM